MPYAPADRLLRALAPSLLPVAKALGPAPARNPRGDALDGRLQAMIRLQGLVGGAVVDDDPVEARTAFVRSARVAASTPPAVVTVDATLPGPGGPLRVRRYLPPTHDAPTMVYFHGGGWAVGDLDTSDPFVRHLAVEAGVRIVSVDYRLAPEHPFPAALDDALAAVAAVEAEVGSPVGVGGDSAGGHLSALVAAARPVAFQLLVYPATDLRRGTASHRTLRTGFLLEGESIDRYLAWLGADPDDPAASPALQPVPSVPSVVVTAGFDPLRDEGEQHAERLRAAGAPVHDLRFPHLTHGFIHYDGMIPAAADAVAQIADALRRVAWPRDTVSPPEDG